MTDEKVTPDAGDAQIRPFHDGAQQKAEMRKDMMGEIARNAREARNQALGELEAEPEPEATPPVEEPPEETPPTDPEPEDEVTMVTIKVDGEEKEVPESEVIEQGIRTLQKESAADKRLEAATEKLDAAREAWEAAQQQQRQAPEEEPPQDRGVLRERAQSFVSNLLDGTEENAVEKLMDLMEQPAPKVNQEEIIDRAAEKAMQQFNVRDERRERAEAIESFRETRADIAGNEMLWNEMDRFATEYASENTSARPAEVLAAAEKHVDALLDKIRPQSQETDFQEKHKRKARATENMRQASHRQQKPPPEEPPTRSQVINQRKKRLGQAIY